ncbi:hypothetical protein [Acidisarcina polymorpha]|nr:hypothetical protein [Acidisarcina polymorpha]
MNHPVFITCLIRNLSPVAEHSYRMRIGSRRHARPMIFLVLAVAGAYSLMVRAQSPERQTAPQVEEILFRDVTLIDVVGGSARKGMDVLVHGERIERIFRTQRLTAACC